ncbi:MAG: tyrosine-type recombinase/integrase [Spirochaetia bacterium]
MPVLLRGTGRVKWEWQGGRPCPRSPRTAPDRLCGSLSTPVSDFQRSYAGTSSAWVMRGVWWTPLFRNHADLRHIQTILGHGSITSTEIYTHVSLEDLKEVVRRAHPHGRK